MVVDSPARPTMMLSMNNCTSRKSTVDITVVCQMNVCPSTPATFMLCMILDTPGNTTPHVDNLWSNNRYTRKRCRIDLHLGRRCNAIDPDRVRTSCTNNNSRVTIATMGSDRISTKAIGQSCLSVCSFLFRNTQSSTPSLVGQTIYQEIISR